MEFLFDLPWMMAAPTLIGAMCLLAIAGLWWFRRHLLPRLVFEDVDSYFSSAMIPSIMVFYGLVMALISVHVWEGNLAAQSITSREATSIAALYRDVSGYPEPARDQLHQAIRDYVNYVIHESWPLQRKGKVPSGGVELVDRIQEILMGFEPATEGQKVLAAETLRAYNVMVEARRLRLDAVDTHLPGVMWCVILFGAVISFLTSYCFPVTDPRVHFTLVTLLAAFVGIILFLIVELDRPFRGDLAITPRSYQLVYDHLMKP